ncbi:hypothetical protein EMPS_06558 [Entomortierella parvispora]|uniref:Uncharacterized protein n=1 Tax=Entomortierella parvispora TaxID=205924 RepID=A0A9P3LXU9_9FUNG|nr:hypothetical protein EMPS_06558 [Entomortierella parvispora]
MVHFKFITDAAVSAQAFVSNVDLKPFTDTVASTQTFVSKVDLKPFTDTVAAAQPFVPIIDLKPLTSPVASAQAFVSKADLKPFHDSVTNAVSNVDLKSLNYVASVKTYVSNVDLRPVTDAATSAHTYVTNNVDKKTAKYIAAGVAGAVAAPILVTGVVSMAGFSSPGIVSGSLGSGYMASYGGAVAAGSSCAILQSIGAAGLGTAGTLMVSVVGGAAAVGGVAIADASTRAAPVSKTSGPSGEAKIKVLCRL